MVTKATALVDRTIDLSSNSVAVKSVERLLLFSSNCQKGEPNEETTILNRLGLVPESSSHFLIASSIAFSKLKQLEFLSVPMIEVPKLFTDTTVDIFQTNLPVPLCKLGVTVSPQTAKLAF